MTSPTPPVYARLLDKLDCLRSLDRERAVFGASTHGYEMRPPLAEADVKRFEDVHGVTLPDEYRGFLLHVGSAGAGPAYGLLPLETWSPEGLPSVTATVTTKQGETFSAGTGPRPPMPRAARLSEPFTLSAAWAPVDAQGSPATLPSPADKNLYDGCLHLAEIGCGYLYILVVTGDQRGKIWSDYTAGDGALAPHGLGFAGWYEQWLDEQLAGVLLELIRKGLAGDGAPDVREPSARFVAVFEERARQNPVAYAELGLVLLYLGRREEAESAFAEASRGPSTPPFLSELRERLFAEALVDARADPPRRLEQLVGHSLADVRVALAQNPSTPEVALFELSSDAEPRVLLAVAENPTAGGRSLERAYSRASGAPRTDLDALFLLERVARHRSTPATRLHALSRYDLEPSAEPSFEHVVVRAAALSEAIAADDLARLAKHPAPSVRHAAALHLGAPKEMLEALSNDEDPIVRSAVAANGSTDARCLARLALDLHEEVRAQVAAHPRADAATFLRLVVDRSYNVASAAASSRSLTLSCEELLASHPNGAIHPTPPDSATDSTDSRSSKAVDPDPRSPRSPAFVTWASGVFDQPSSPVALFPLKMETLGAMPAYAMALHPWLTTSLLEGLSRHSYGYARARVASHRLCPDDLLLTLSRDPQPLVRAAAASNPRLPVSRVIELASDSAEAVRTGAGRHPGLPAEVMRKLAEDEERWTRRSLLFREDTPQELLEQLARDKESHVRRWVAANLRAPRSIVAALAEDQDADVKRFVRWRVLRDELLGSLPS